MNILFWHRLPRKQVKCSFNKSESCGSHSNCGFGHPSFNMLILLFNKKKKQHQQDLELPLFGLSTLVKATNDFSKNNKLGEGGFGPVYKVKEFTQIAAKNMWTHIRIVAAYSFFNGKERRVNYRYTGCCGQSRLLDRR
ncbi:putative non-specific serine/threonine protein kinase [Helianthus anomalus]